MKKSNKKFARKIVKKASKIKGKVAKKNKGFSKEPAWLKDARWFKVEMCYEDAEENQTNHRTMWLGCCNFNPKQREFLRKYLDLNKVPFSDRETEESKYVLTYVDYYFSLNAVRDKLNTAYIFPVKNIEKDTVQYPLYIRKWADHFNPQYTDAMIAILDDYIWKKD